MYLILEHLLVVLGVLAVALAMVLALQQPRSPQSSAAWILFIVLVPYVAVPVFLALGVRRPGPRTPALHLPEGPGTPAGPNAALLAALGAPAATGGNRIALHTTPDAARIALESAVAQARQRIDVLLYRLDDDASGRGFVERLTAAAQAGIAVRLCLDRLGTLRPPRAALAALAAAGGEVRFFPPLRRMLGRGELNLRNHRKLVVADGALAWAGGRNAGDVYLASPPGQWMDLSFAVEGPVAAQLAQLFHADWAMAGGDGDTAPEAAAPGPPGTAVLQLVPAGPDMPLDTLHDGIVAALHRADRRIWIATPYFVPSEAMAQALCTAARRGVEVRIYLPDRSNQWTADLARGAYLRAAAAAGCRILRYRPGMMHAKAGMIDGLAWVGSANFDVRSMLLNFELVMACHDADSRAALERWFTGLDRDCDEGLAPAGLLRRLTEGIFRLGAPIL